MPRSGVATPSGRRVEIAGDPVPVRPVEVYDLAALAERHGVPWRDDAPAEVL